MKQTLAMILAGGKGSRLEPLTSKRAKPAVPFGGKYRIIDFVISNMVNSDIMKIVILPQYESASLERHVREVWTPRAGFRQAIYTLAPRSGKGKDWYKGTADAIFQNKDRIEEYLPDRVAVFGGDHIYTMDVSKMVETHNNKSDLTIAAIKTKISEENFEMKDHLLKFKYGVIEVDENNRVMGFQEKPKKPKEIPGQEGYCWVSMGNYIFKTSVLINELEEDSKRKDSNHDFGSNIIPEMQKNGMNIFVHPFEGYWRDVGDVESYFKANIDLNRDKPPLDLYDPRWPIGTSGSNFPPTRLLRYRSTVSEGCILDGEIENCVLSPGVRIGKNSIIRDSIIFNNVRIGEDVRIKNAIIDKGNFIESGSQIGYDQEEDRKRDFFLTHSGIVVIQRGKLI